METLLGAAGPADAAGRCAVLFAALGATLRDNPSPQVNVCRAPCKIFGDLRVLRRRESQGSPRRPSARGQTRSRRHGQFRDLLLFFLEFGCPSHRCGDVEYCEYVFNGDWVDRGAAAGRSSGSRGTGARRASSASVVFLGAHQLECLVLLAALKIRYPRRVHLNRGNHESAAMCQSMTERGDRGFDKDCAEKLGDVRGGDVFKKACDDVFRWLPLATVVESAVLVVHGAALCPSGTRAGIERSRAGGIGDGKWTLGDLSDIPYPLDEVRDHPLAWQLCWSDPDWRGDGVEARGVHARASRASIRTSRPRPSFVAYPDPEARRAPAFGRTRRRRRRSVRGLDTKTFGPDVSRAFCRSRPASAAGRAARAGRRGERASRAGMNGINCVVRSHEYVPQGIMIQHGGYVVTVFSARDYDYKDKKDPGEQNCGAIISVTLDHTEGRDVIRLRAKIIEKCVT